MKSFKVHATYLTQNNISQGYKYEHDIAYTYMPHNPVQNKIKDYQIVNLIVCALSWFDLDILQKITT